MHPKNIHQNKYDLTNLCETHPSLKEFVFVNKYGTKSIDFTSNKAVKALNTALLKYHYSINYWQFPDSNLCPPIPGRADYLHHLNDLLGNPTNVKILDIGTGATVIYPLLGTALFEWKFVASDINKQSIKNALRIIKKNHLFQQIDLRQQTNPLHILKGIVQPNENFSASMCNPPFFASEDAVKKANLRKTKGIHRRKKRLITNHNHNFSGISNELWTVGGEKKFVTKYISESVLFSNQFTWFTTLISNKKHLKPLLLLLQKIKAKTKTIEVSQGHKTVHILAWQFNH